MTARELTKPAYRIPSMAEIAAVPANGYRAISTFSGAGGSCLGFRWAGFEIVFASEFVPAARDTYLANWPGAIVDSRDIRTVTAGEILTAAGMAVGECDVLEGSPPCASFSTAGRREQSWGKVKNYSDTAQQADDLFFEYARLVDGIRPRIFVAENVSGLVKGVAKGYFVAILRRLRGCGYRVSARVLDAEWLGVPQTRDRLVFVGVREDLAVEPAFPAPLGYRYSVRDAIGDLLAVRTKRGRQSADRPAPTVQTHGRRGTESELTAEELLGVGSNGPYGTVGWRSPDAPAHSIGASPQTGNGRNPAGEILTGVSAGGFGNRAYRDPSSPAETVGTGPWKGNGVVANGVELTASGGRVVRRKFTIDELRRICGFPDDFKLTGSYNQQWERLGRAVPPPMMHAVALKVRELLAAADA